MRARIAVIAMFAGGVAGCADTAPSEVSYAPPADQPTRPDAGYVGRPSVDLIWDQLLDRLTQSDLQVGLADRQRGVMVATYSGDPTPYVTCGSILLEGDGAPQEIDASGDASFRRVVGGRSVAIDRDLKLDARLAIEVKPRGEDAFVETTGNYVLTKTVVAAGQSGRQSGAYEMVSFSTGERGVFRKGTVCQPNGALERTVLDIMPSATQVAQHRPEPGATRRSTIVRTEIASDDPARQPAAGDDPVVQPLADPGPRQAASDDRPPSSSECTIADTRFCTLLEITDPYRRANEERGLGLEAKPIGPGNPLVEGSGLGLDISLPNYDAYLAVSYFLRDGTVHHVLSGRRSRWPANAREFVGGPGPDADQSGNVEMVVALASDVPLFPSPRPAAEAADTYLADLRRRLAEMSDANGAGRIAASLLVLAPGLQQPS